MSARAEFLKELCDHTDNFRGVTWKGLPVWQPPLDLWNLQEVLHELRPELIVETGTGEGGSAIFMANAAGLQAKVMTVDVQAKHRLTHSQVTYLVGDSTDPEIYATMRDAADRCEGPVFVTLDGCHVRDHVAEELRLYAPLVTPGSWILVQDGIIDVMPLPFMEEARPGPLPAIWGFLAGNPDFAVDEELCNRYLATYHPKGWLRRLR